MLGSQDPQVVVVEPVSVGTTVTVVYVVVVTLVVVAESGIPKSLSLAQHLYTLASGIYSQVGSPVTVTTTVVQPQKELV